MVKRLLFKMLVMMVIFTGIAAYVASINGIDVRKAISAAISNTHLPNMPRHDKLLPDGLKLPDKNELIYKWKDADGVWNFSADKPEGAEVEVIELTPDRNLVLATELPVAEQAGDPQQSGQAQGTELMQKNQQVLFPYSADNVKQLIQDAKDVQNKVDERYKRLEEAVGN